MKKYITYFLMAAALIGGATACNEDDLTKESSFDNMTPYRTAFDEWLLDNYVTPYNIDFKYKFEYKESDTDYNLAPAELSKSVAMAKLVKYLWIDAYVEVQGNNRDFICTYGPKMIHLIGSPAYDNGKITLGTAEGGLKVTLYNINALNPNSVDVEMMNRWYFSTMHHEFSHILHQTIEFPQDFYNPQIQISAESETKRSIFRKRDKTKRSKKESAQHSKSRNKSFVMTSVSAL